MLPSSSSALRQLPVPGSSSKIEPTIAWRAGAAGQSDGDRGQVDAQAEDAAAGQRVQMAPGAAAEVEHRTAQRAQRPLVDLVGGLRSSGELQRPGRPVGEADDAGHARRRARRPSA